MHASRFAIFVFAASAALLSARSADAQVGPERATTLIIVPAPDRRPAGAEAEDTRAGTLAASLAHARVAAVYGTGAPPRFAVARNLADALAVELRPHDFDRSDPDGFAGALLASVLPSNGGRAVALVVPTEVIPFLLRRAARVDAEAVGPVSADDLFVVTVAPGYASVVRASLPSPEPSAEAS